MVENKERNVEVDIFRIISVFGIVWFHSGVKFGREIAGGGLIYFVIVSVYFATKSKRTHSFFDRAKRLLIPWLIWSLFYGIIKFAIKGNIYPKEYTLFSKILATPSVHLWFSPFIFFVLIAIDNLREYFRKKWVVPFLGLSIVIIALLAPIWRDFAYIPPLGQYASAIPAVFIKILFGIFNDTRMRLIVFFCIISLILIVVFKQQPGAISYLIGIIPCYFLFHGRMKTKEKLYTTYITSTAMGIYLLHIFVLIVLMHVGVTGLWLPVTAFVISLFSILLLKNNSHLKIAKYFA